jgi:hypothetical protein
MGLESLCGIILVIKCFKKWNIKEMAARKFEILLVSFESLEVATPLFRIFINMYL